MAEDLQAGSRRVRSILGPVSPISPTPQSMAHALTNEANEATSRIIEASVAQAENFGGDRYGLVKRFLMNPDAEDVVRATGGYSQSRPAKRAALVMRRVVGEWDEKGVAFYAAKAQKAEDDAVGLERKAAAATQTAE